MDYLGLDEELEIHADLYRYRRLHRWLTYEGYSTLIWGGGFFLPVGLVGTVALAAAVVFVPIMIWDLVATKHRGWIVTWLVLVFMPTILMLVFGPDRQRLMAVILTFLPASYVYFWILRTAVDTWVGTLEARLELVRSRYLSALNES